MKNQYLKINSVNFGQFSLRLAVFAAMLILSSVRTEQAQTLDTAFNPNVRLGGEVRAIAAQSDGKILMGGNFDRVSG